MSVGDRESVRRGFRGARDKDGPDLLPIRAAQGSGLEPGKYGAKAKLGYISYGGKEIQVRDPKAEIFLGSGVGTAFKGDLPLGAIPAGYDSDGSTLYMISAQKDGTQALCNYSDARGEAYIPYGGDEIKVASFEVLC